MDGATLAWTLVGFAGGAAGTWALLRSRDRPALSGSGDARLTSTWRLAELGAPLVVARDVDADVPDGAKVVASGQVAAEAFAAAEVRQVPHVAAEYAVAADGRRALLFLGGVRRGAQALPTSDAVLVARLHAEAQALWARAVPYVETRPLAEAATRHGLVVETQGLVQDVLAYQGAFLIRLEDAGQVLGVQVPKDPSELKGQRIVVRGKVGKDKGGYAVLLADDVRAIE